MVICAAVGCDTDSKQKNPNKLSLFGLPRDKKFKKIWIQKLKRENLPAEQNIKVCNLHFTEDCFKRDLQVFSLN